MTNLVVLLDPMHNQPEDAKFDVQHLSINVSLYSMKLGYDAHFHAFAPMFHCGINQILGTGTVIWGGVFFVNCLEHSIPKVKRVSNILTDFGHSLLCFVTLCMVEQANSYCSLFSKQFYRLIYVSRITLCMIHYTKVYRQSRS